MSEYKQWICPACKEPVVTPFCGRCGEEPLAVQDLTIRGLTERLVHALTSIDARAVRTTQRLLRYPGELTLAWVNGIRKPYVAPFQIFLIINVIFFGVQSLTGENVFSSTLDSHLHVQDWSDLAQSLVANHLEIDHIRLEAYAPIFDRTVILYAKSLVVLMTIPFALLLPLIFIRERRPFMVHVVFSLHFYSVLLLLFCIDLIAAKFSALLGTGGLGSPRVDNTLTVVNIMASALYLYISIGPVYSAAGVSRTIKALVLSVAVVAIVVGYRFVLFVITLYGT